MKSKQPSPQSVPKILGSDLELGNFLQGLGSHDTVRAASRLLLRHIPGIPGGAYGGCNPQDVGRKWLDNGSCCYIDLDHLEFATAETTNAFDFTAAVHSQFRIVEAARKRAAATLPSGASLKALVCNSDGSGSSWGAHLNFLITRSAFEDIFRTRLQCLLWLASYTASSIVIHGQGKVGAENGDSVGYQISQRADFIEEIVGPQTTYRRPMINSRDEPLAGPESDLARFHYIASDANLCHTANVLKVGILQILLAMVEHQAQIEPNAILEDPVRAMAAYSHCPDLEHRERDLSGKTLTAIEHQWRFFDAAAAFVETGACETNVPRAREILTLWGDTLDLLEARDWESASRRLDWVLKFRFLEEVLRDNPRLSWKSPEIKRLDLMYGSLDPTEGIYWSLEEADCIDRLVSKDHIETLSAEPPRDTRAFSRANLLRAFGEVEVVSVDWDRVTVRKAANSRGYWACSQTIHLDDPAGFSEKDAGELFQFGGQASKEVLLRSFPSEVQSPPAPTLSQLENPISDGSTCCLKGSTLTGLGLGGS